MAKETSLESCAASFNQTTYQVFNLHYCWDISKMEHCAYCLALPDGQPYYYFGLRNRLFPDLLTEEMSTGKTEALT